MGVSRCRDRCHWCLGKARRGCWCSNSGEIAITVSEGALARPLTGSLGGFLTGKFNEYRVGCWWDIMNCWVMTNKVELVCSSASQTGCRRCGFRIREIHQPDTGKGTKIEDVCGLLSCKNDNPPQVLRPKNMEMRSKWRSEFNLAR